MNPEQITRETFRWRTKDKICTIDQMDVDFKLIALKHCLSHANEHFAKMEKARKQQEKHHGNVAYFMAMAEVLENALITDHNLEVPSTPEDVAAMRRMIKQGIIKVSKPDAPDPTPPQKL